MKQKITARQAIEAREHTRQLLDRTPARLHGKVTAREQLAADLAAFKRICERLPTLLERIGTAIRYLERSDRRRSKAIQALLKRLIVLQNGIGGAPEREQLRKEDQ